MPKFETSDEFRDLFEQSCTNFAKGSAEVGTKVIGTHDRRTPTAHSSSPMSSPARSVSGKPPPCTAPLARKQMEVCSTQAQELAALVQKVTTETMTPLTSAFRKCSSQPAPPAEGWAGSLNPRNVGFGRDQGKTSRRGA